MSDLENYRKEFLNRVRAACEDNATTQQEEFFHLTTSLLSESGYLDDVEYKEHLDTRRGIRIDGFNFNPLEKQISAIVIHYNGLDKITTLNKSELEKAGKRAARFLEKIDDEAYINKQADTNNGRQILDSLRMYKDIAKYRVVLLTDCISKASKLQIDPIRETDTNIEVWDISKFKEIEESGSESLPFTIDLKKMCNGISALPANFKGASLESYLCILPGDALRQIYDDHGQRLLESNVRTFLGTRGKINRGMRNTLLTNPESFFAYNNGLTLTATSIKKKKTDKGLILTELENLQIVNGGQTTSSIFFSPLEKGGLPSGEKFKEIDLTKVFVQAKLTVIGDTDQHESELFKSRISEYSNTQNAVNKADLVSNDPLHLRIENLSRKVLMPAGETGVATKWFYERARGAYQTTMRNLTSAKVRTWQAEYPKNQVFLKTDMAKYENTWRMNPYEVKKGAQNNLTEIGSILKKEFEKDENIFREPFYKDLISKAILFKTTEKSISNSEWYKAERGLRAEMVTYSISFLRYLLKNKGEDINLTRIFNNQGLSDSLTSQLIELAQFIKEKINDPSFRDGMINVSEFCKSEKAWNKFKRLDFELKLIDKADIITDKQLAKRKKETEEIGAAGEVIDIFDMVMHKTSKEEWEMLSKHYEDQGFPSDHPNVNIPFICSKIGEGKIPSEKQMSKALDIRKTAIQEENFTYISKER